VPAILAFLDSLEKKRGNSVRTRNIRLAAIRSFFRLVALRDPDSVGLATRILAIPVKRQDKKLVGYLTRDEINAILDVPDKTRWSGRRDRALLLTMYNSGARVLEITSLQRNQVHFGESAFLQLNGKGRKERTVPLWPHTSKVLQAWFLELEGKFGMTAFPNARGKPFTIPSELDPRRLIELSQSAPPPPHSSRGKSSAISRTVAGSFGKDTWQHNVDLRSCFHSGSPWCLQNLKSHRGYPSDACLFEARLRPGAVHSPRDTSIQPASPI
jgi:integrase